MEIPRNSEQFLAYDTLLRGITVIFNPTLTSFKKDIVRKALDVAKFRVH